MGRRRRHTLVGRLLVHDDAAMRFEEISIEAGPMCPACGTGRHARHSGKTHASQEPPPASRGLRSVDLGILDAKKTGPFCSAVAQSYAEPTTSEDGARMTQYRRTGDKKTPWPGLRPFRPITELPGKRLAWLALALVVIGYGTPAAVKSDFTGIVLGALICATGIVVGWRARDSRGRGIAWTAIVLGVWFTFAYLVALRFVTM